MATVVQYRELGGPEVLELAEVPTPQAAPDQVVVEIRAAGVNPIEWKQRSGLRPTPPITEPRRLGSDGAGVIVQVGSAITGWSVGDPVIIKAGAGTYASHLATTVDHLLEKPAVLSFEQAAAIGIPTSTAYQALKSLDVGAGTRLLIHGGSGGVGQAAVQFGRLWGAEVVATAGPDNHDRLRELGAVPIAYGPGLLDRLREIAPDGFDRILDAAGTDEALEASFALVDDRQRIGTVVAGPRAAELGIQAWQGGNPVPLTAEQQRWRDEAYAAVAELIASGDFELEISRSYPLAQVVEATRQSESGHVRGKLVLIP
ncbi:NADP-dependent oxidoreductase [Microlunatus soli]|uniref:Enoyl reductase n=1 Tax=Microlunatus soli TaxID=630515 RepID=A0A1H1RNT1_9ACTN|nr:NADP-dependent oxidoreductase [Microlunatus soli]SDS37364.1 enoyl reductase [Microlunatus soli]